MHVKQTIKLHSQHPAIRFAQQLNTISTIWNLCYVCLSKLVHIILQPQDFNS